MSRWPREPFDSVIADESGGNLKTPQSEFLPSGRYPIVDQGKDLVAGYTDDKSRLCRATLPVIVFGDHTRCFKYIDFPFCMGADGIKVLRPKVQADVKYLYHYLRQLRLTEGGYDRHFKYLKRSTIALPSLPEQRRIAEILDKADTLRAQRRAALAQLDTLIQSIFLDMFGDPATNPRGIEKRRIADVVSRITNGFVGPTRNIYQGSGVPYLLARHVKANKLTFDGKTFISEAFNQKNAKSILNAGDVLLVQSGHIGESAVVPPEHEGHNCHAMIVLTPRPEALNGQYLSHVFATPAMQRAFKAIQTGITLAHLNCRDVRELRIPIPPLSLQRAFARRVAFIDHLKSTQSSSLAQSNALIEALQHQLFHGELTA